LPGTPEYKNAATVLSVYGGPDTLKVERATVFCEYIKGFIFAERYLVALSLTDLSDRLNIDGPEFPATVEAYHRVVFMSICLTSIPANGPSRSSPDGFANIYVEPLRNEKVTWLSSTIEFSSVDSEEAARLLNELTELYADVYSEAPYEWGHEHVELFAERFHGQRRQVGFSLVDARDDGRLVGVGFGVTLLPNTPWWQNLTAPVDGAITQEYPNRTFALVELLVRKPWRRHHVAESIHDQLLANRAEERATLTVLPAAEAAQAAYRKWGWERIGQKRNPLPGSPVFDVMVKRLS
jgi:GNAT superfamily N-acetyltransferase